MSGIEITGLVKQWGPTRAVDEVSFDVPEGSLTVLLGPSGCGKSTILRMIAGLESVSAGRVTIGGRDVTDLEPAERGVSMVFQSYALFPHLDVRENILFGLKVRRVSAPERERRLAAAATMVGLDTLLDRKPANLSGGQRQRVALARAIVADQPICLMDEPLSNLDAKLRAEMRDEIRALQRKLGLTMVYVTHDQVEAMSMADQVILLRDGRIEQIGDPATLYEKPASVFAARFLGTPPMNVLEASALTAQGVSQLMLPALTPDSKIGLRPEAIQVVQDGLSATIRAIDYMGAETVLRLQMAGQELMIRVAGRPAMTVDSQIQIAWRPQDVHLFASDGQRRADDASRSQH